MGDEAIRGVCSLVANFETLVKKRRKEHHGGTACEGAGLRAHRFREGARSDLTRLEHHDQTVVCDRSQLVWLVYYNFDCYIKYLKFKTKIQPIVAVRLLYAATAVSVGRL